VTVKLGDLETLRKAMTCGRMSDLVSGLIDGDDGFVAEMLGTPARQALNLSGIVATHNAADVLIEIAKAALAWRAEIGKSYNSFALNRAEHALRDALSRVTA